MWQATAVKMTQKWKIGQGFGANFCCEVALWTHGQDEPWPAIATPFYTAIVAGHTAVEPAKGEPPR